MAREIVAWCDLCIQSDERVPGHPLTLSLDGGRPLRLDLCDEHRKSLAEPLLDALRTYGAAPDSPPPSKSHATSSRGERLVAEAAEGRRRGQRPGEQRAFQCLWCPLDYSSSGALGDHLRKVHGRGSMAEAFGTTCPLCGGTYQNLGAHGSRSHNGANVAQLFLQALGLGDSLGVVARVREAEPVNA